MKNEVLAFIREYTAGIRDAKTYERDFNEVALKLFRYQFQHNSAYKKFCQQRRKTPLTVKNWTSVPPMPIQGFKELSLSCVPTDKVEAVFMTSGTTNPEKKGRNYHPTLEVWDASMLGPFGQFVLPDIEKITIFVISPAEDLNKNSSLSRYLSLAVKRYGTEKSQFFFHENGLDIKGLVEALEKQDEPVLLMGATFAYVHVLDYLKEHHMSFTLPKGSRIFDTGGFKGQSREIEMETLYQMFGEYFGVPRELCINMYGMTELSSQFYDQTIQTGKVNIAKKGPAWIRTLVLDPNTLEVVEDGKTGVLAHFDLANWNSSFAILTEDIGYKQNGGIVLLGRISGSEARGCSIAVDELLQATKK